MNDTDMIDTLCERIKRLEAYIEEDARCPYCQELKECNNECTFEKNSLELLALFNDANYCDRYERMIKVRELLYGNEDKQ